MCRRHPARQTQSPATLDRAFSKAGWGSRTQARGWIEAGKVRVNGKTVFNPDHWVDLARDRIALDGKPLRATAGLYILLNKPKGILTTRSDPGGRPTVYDLIGDVDGWLSPVGRLDLETSGLLILTNDTAFADRVSSPRHKVPKTYRVKTADALSEEQLGRLRQGVELRDGPTRPATAIRLRDGPGYTYLEMTITEGRNRQVRRMIEAVGSKVRKLVRTAIGPIAMRGLASGQWRPLTPAEVAALGGGTSADRPIRWPPFPKRAALRPGENPRKRGD
jgi:pseudouridine synthase